MEEKTDKSQKEKKSAKAGIEMLTENKQGLRCMAGVWACRVEGKQK